MLLEKVLIKKYLSIEDLSIDFNNLDFKKGKNTINLDKQERDNDSLEKNHSSINLLAGNSQSGKSCVLEVIYNLVRSIENLDQLNNKSLHQLFENRGIYDYNLNILLNDKNNKVVTIGSDSSTKNSKSLKINIENEGIDLFTLKHKYPRAYLYKTGYNLNYFQVNKTRYNQDLLHVIKDIINNILELEQEKGLQVAKEELYLNNTPSYLLSSSLSSLINIISFLVEKHYFSYLIDKTKKFKRSLIFLIDDLDLFWHPELCRKDWGSILNAYFPSAQFIISLKSTDSIIAFSKAIVTILGNKDPRTDNIKLYGHSYNQVNKLIYGVDDNINFINCLLEKIKKEASQGDLTLAKTLIKKYKDIISPTKELFSNSELEEIEQLLNNRRLMINLKNTN